MKRIAGVCYFKVDGEQLEVKGGIEVPLGETIREAVMSLTGVAGYKETARKPYVKVDAIFGGAFPLDKITGDSDMTITVELANGKTYVLSEAKVEGEPTVNPEEGTTALEFFGKRGQYI